MVHDSMMLNCTSCGTDNRPGAAFCLGCGARLGPSSATKEPSSSRDGATWAPTAEATVQSRHCGNCGATNRAIDNFCKSCGAAIGPAAVATTMMPMATAAAPPPQRSKAPIIAFAAVALLLLVGGGFVLLAGGGGDDAAPAVQTDDADALDDGDPSEEDAPVASELPDSTEVGVTGSVATIPAQVVPTTTLPVPETTAPPPPVDTTTPPPIVVPGDLGLAQPMTRPPCDDTYITVLISSLDPATDATAVADALARYPGSAYLKTIETCPSLRPSVNGAEIYVVYFGPFLTDAEACAARASGPSDAYVRILSLTVPDTHRIAC